MPAAWCERGAIAELLIKDYKCDTSICGENGISLFHSCEGSSGNLSIV